MFFPMIEALIIALALSLDAFVAAFAYGSRGIRIPPRSIHTINFICTGMVGLAFFSGAILRHHIPEGLAPALSFGILFSLGMIKLLDHSIKSAIRKFSVRGREIRLSLRGIHLILTLYADPEQADLDGSKILSPAEAATLALALSLDGLAVGLGAALGSVSVWLVLATVWLTGLAALFAGTSLGNKAAKRLRFDLSWLSGVLLILLAFSNLQ